MTVRIILAVSALLGVGAFGLIGTLAHEEMVDKVNEKLPERERFQPLGWYWPKSQRLRREYRRLYPGGRLIIKTRVVAGIMMAFLVLAASLLVLNRCAHANCDNDTSPLSRLARLDTTLNGRANSR
jgi:hypothetical protein